MHLRQHQHPNTPSGVSGEFDNNDIKLSWDAVEDAKSYVVHYGGANQANPNDATFMGYTESTAWTLNSLDIPALEIGDKIYLYVQAYDQLGEGATETEKAQYLHDGPYVGSAWSTPIELTKE